MPLALAAQQIPPSLPIEFLRKIERLRRVNPALLDLIEQSNGFRFPSERITSPTRAPMQRIRARAPARPMIRDADGFASFRTEKEYKVAKVKSAIAARQAASNWGGPRSSVRILFEGPLTNLLRDPKRHPVSYGGGGPLPVSPPVDLSVLVDGLRVTDDDLARVTDEDFFRVID